MWYNKGKVIDERGDIMPMEREKHEELLIELNNPEIDHTRRTDILQKLRTDYISVVTDFTDLTTNVDKLKKDNDDLIVSNSKLFRQVGISGDEKLEEKESQKDFSESITIEDFEKVE